MGVTKMGLGGETARVTSQDLFGASGAPRVVVVGAGFGGIGVGVKLKKAGIDTFTIYESSLGVGGSGGRGQGSGGSGCELLSDHVDRSAQDRVSQAGGGRRRGTGEIDTPDWGAGGECQDPVRSSARVERDSRALNVWGRFVGQGLGLRRPPRPPFGYAVGWEPGARC